MVKLHYICFNSEFKKIHGTFKINNIYFSLLIILYRIMLYIFTKTNKIFYKTLIPVENFSWKWQF